MHEIHITLLRGQMHKDTIWCSCCAMMHGRATVPAVVAYTVAEVGVTVPVCKSCFDRERQRIEIISSAPVVQPEYIAVLERALAHKDRETALTVLFSRT